MSWEGYQQNICADGHSYETDPYDDYFDGNADEDKEPILHHGPKCICGAECIWWNLVDTTNGSWDEAGNRIDGFVKLERLTKEELATCSLNCVHIIKFPTYKIPEGIGHKKDS